MAKRKRAAAAAEQGERAGVSPPVMLDETRGAHAPGSPGEDTRGAHAPGSPGEETRGAHDPGSPGAGSPAAHYSDHLPCDAAMRRSVAKLLVAGVPLDRHTAFELAAILPEASVREIMRHELDRDLSGLYERLVKVN